MKALLHQEIWILDMEKTPCYAAREFPTLRARQAGGKREARAARVRG